MKSSPRNNVSILIFYNLEAYNQFKVLQHINIFLKNTHLDNLTDYKTTCLSSHLVLGFSYQQKIF